MAWIKNLSPKSLKASSCSIALAFIKHYSSNRTLQKLKPMILKRIENREKDYPIPYLIPVAQEVLQARNNLINSVSALTKFFPVLTCKFCPEVHIGEPGHLIRTCRGYRRRSRVNLPHEWVPGSVTDILVPVEAFHLTHMFQDIIKHEHRFNFDRIPAVVELCTQAGADPSKCDQISSIGSPKSPLEMAALANETLKWWEMVRCGVERLMMGYPVKVCACCEEVHVGPSGHRARLCGVFKFERWRAYHYWKKAEVDDLVPKKVVWRRRAQDPNVLVHEGRGFYGHAPAVVDLCVKGGAFVPKKYASMMKEFGLTAPVRVEF